MNSLRLFHNLDYAIIHYAIYHSYRSYIISTNDYYSHLMLLKVTIKFTYFDSLIYTIFINKIRLTKHPIKIGSLKKLWVGIVIEN